jgi:hypothetical protein
MQGSTGIPLPPTWRPSRPKTRQGVPEQVVPGLIGTWCCCVEYLMRRSNWTPSIVPNDEDQNVYLVVDDFGRNGGAWREADVEATDLETVILDMLGGQYKSPLRVVAFNTTGKWSQDVSADVAHELRQRCDLQLRDVPFFLQDFVDRHEGRYRDIQLPLPMRLA